MIRAGVEDVEEILREAEEWEEENEEDSKEEVSVEEQPESSGRDDLGYLMDELGPKFSHGDACEMLDVASGKPLARLKDDRLFSQGNLPQSCILFFCVGYRAARPSATVLASAYRWVAAGRDMNLVYHKDLCKEIKLGLGMQIRA